MNKELNDFISQHIHIGTPKEEIRQMLLDRGWDAAQVDAALNEAAVTPTREITHLRGTIELIRASFSLVMKRLVTIIAVALPPWLILIALFGGAGAWFFLTGRNDLSNFIPLVLGVIILALVSSFVGSWVQLSLIYAIGDSTIGAKEALRRGWHNIFAYWWVMFLYGFVIMGGFMLLIIPGIMFAIWFSLTVFVFVFENERGMNALLKSKEYVKGYGRAVFFRFLLLMLFLIIFVMIAQALGRMIAGNTGATILNNIASMISTPIVIAFTYCIYSDLKLLKGPIAFDPTKHNKVIYIVIAVIGLILMIALPVVILLFTLQPNKMMDRARDAQTKSELNAVKFALDQYYIDNNQQYPMVLENVVPVYLQELPPGIQYKRTEYGGNYELCVSDEDSRTCYTSQDQIY